MSNIEKLTYYIKRCIEQSSQLHTTNLSADLQRKSLLFEVYKLMFNKSPFEHIESLPIEPQISHGDAKIEIEEVSNYSNYSFYSEDTKLILSCRYETPSDQYSMIIPLNKHQMDLYLCGIISLGEINFIMMNVDKEFIILNKVTNEKKCGSWKFPYHTNELSELDVMMITLLEESAFEWFSKINYKWLFEEGEHTDIDNDELDTLRIWSHLYTSFVSQNVFNDFCGLPTIDISSDWSEYKDFVEWAKMNGYFEGASILRCDEQSGYVPSNCVWISKTALTAERYYYLRNNMNLSPGNLRRREVSVMGTNKPLYEWERISGIPSVVILGRVSSGVKDHDLFHEIGTKDLFDKYKDTPIFIDGEEKTLIDWSKKTGISFKTIVSRLVKGKKGKALIYRP